MIFEELPEGIQDMTISGQWHALALLNKTGAVAPTAIAVTSLEELADTVQVVPLSNVPQNMHNDTVNYLRRRNVMVMFMTATKAFAAFVDKDNKLLLETLMEHPEKLKEYVEREAAAGKGSFTSGAIALAIYYADSFHLFIYTSPNEEEPEWHLAYSGLTAEAPYMGDLPRELPPEPTDGERSIFATRIEGGANTKDLTQRWASGGACSAETLLATRHGEPTTVEMPMCTEDVVSVMSQQLLQVVQGTDGIKTEDL